MKEFDNYKGWIFIPVLIATFLFTVNSFAVTATEKVTASNTVITLTFTNEEYDLFSLDKGDPKEWVKNAIDVNMQDHTQRIKEDLTKDIKPSNADFDKKVKELKAEKLKKEKELHP